MRVNQLVMHEAGIRVDAWTIHASKINPTFVSDLLLPSAHPSRQPHVMLAAVLPMLQTHLEEDLPRTMPCMRDESKPSRTQASQEREVQIPFFPGVASLAGKKKKAIRLIRVSALASSEEGD